MLCLSRVALAILLMDGLGVSSSTANSPVFRSGDRGRSWLRGDQGLPGGARINAFGASGNVLIAGTDAGIFLSRDEGTVWQASGTIAGRVISIATVGDRVFAGSNKEGLFVSQDQGETWTASSSFPALNVPSLIGHKDGIYAGTDADGVLASPDGGKTWKRLRDGLPEMARIFALTVVRGRLFAGLHAKGLYMWSETEERWAKAGRVTPLVLTAVGDTLIAGHNPGGIFWSDDLGATWTRARFGARTMSVGPDADEAPVWAMEAASGIAFAGAGDGIFYSEDRGRNWTRAKEGLPAGGTGLAFWVGKGFVLAGSGKGGL